MKQMKHLIAALALLFCASAAYGQADPQYLVKYVTSSGKYTKYDPANDIFGFKAIILNGTQFDPTNIITTSSFKAGLYVVGTNVYANPDGITLDAAGALLNGNATLEIKAGGVTITQMAANSVGTTQIVDAAVTTAKLAANSVTTAKLGAVTGAGLQGSNGSVISVLPDGTTLDTLALGSALEIATGGVGTTQLANLGVTTGKLADAGVTPAKLGTVTDGVTLDQLGTGSTLEIKTAGVGTTQLAATSVTAAKLGAITGAGLQGSSGSIISVMADGTTIDTAGLGSSVEVVAGGIGTTQLAAGAVTVAKLGTVTDGVTLDQVGLGSTLEVKTAGVGSTQLATGAVTQGKVASSVVGVGLTTSGTGATTQIAANPDGTTLDTGGTGSSLEIKTGGVGTTQLASSAVTIAKLGTITDNSTLDQLGTGSTLEVKSAGITATQLASSAVTTAKIAATAVTAAKLGSDVAGTGLSGGNGSAIALGVTARADDVFTATASQTTFTLVNGTLTSSNMVDVWVNGVLMEEGAGADYQRNSGTNQIVFNSGLSVTARVRVRVWS